MLEFFLELLFNGLLVGIDLYNDYANVVAGQAVADRPFPVQYCLSITRRDSKNYRYSHDDIMEKFGHAIKAIKDMPEAFVALQGNQVYILTADTQDEIDEMMEFISHTNQ